MAAFQQSAFADHRFRFQEVMTGEMFHVSQRELLGAFILKEADVGRLKEAKLLEPSWLYEGAAQYFELRFGGVGKEEEVYYNELKSKLKTDMGKLSSFEAETLDLSKVKKTSDPGDLAAYQLQEGRDLKLFHRFFKTVGLGIQWKEAFQQAFGVSVEQFYADYAGQ